jgi:hypothetical protein
MLRHINYTCIIIIIIVAAVIMAVATIGKTQSDLILSEY